MTSQTPLSSGPQALGQTLPLADPRAAQQQYLQLLQQQQFQQQAGWQAGPGGMAWPGLQQAQDPQQFFQAQQQMALLAASQLQMLQHQHALHGLMAGHPAASLMPGLQASSGFASHPWGARPPYLPDPGLPSWQELRRAGIAQPGPDDYECKVRGAPHCIQGGQIIPTHHLSVFIRASPPWGLTGGPGAAAERGLRLAARSVSPVGVMRHIVCRHIGRLQATRALQSLSLGYPCAHTCLLHDLLGIGMSQQHCGTERV